MNIESVIKIDLEFKALIPPLTPEEYAQLEINLVAEGCRDDLIVWLCAGEWVLLDGHNRYEICQKHGIGFSTLELDLPSRNAAINWIINNQLGRRNLHPDQASYLRGKRYNGEKQDRGGERGNQYTVAKDQNDNLPKTNERLAAEYNVSPATITRDGQYAAAVDTLAKAGIEPQALIAHEPKSAVITLAKAITPLPDAPLLLPDPVSPVVMDVTDRVKRGEMTVLQAAKAIEKEQQDTFIKEFRERKLVAPPQQVLPKPDTQPHDPVFDALLPNGQSIANGDPKALWLWGWLLECEERFLGTAPDPKTLAGNFLEFMGNDSQRLIPKITHYLNNLLEVLHEPAS